MVSRPTGRSNCAKNGSVNRHSLTSFRRRCPACIALWGEEMCGWAPGIPRGNEFGTEQIASSPLPFA